MKKLLIALIAVAVFSCPAFAWEVNYTDGFESGGLAAWNDGSWGTMTVGDAAAGYTVRTGTYAMKQGLSTVDRVAQDFRYTAQSGASLYAKSGQVEAWVYDDMNWAVGQQDMRVAVVGKNSTWTATNSPASHIVGAVTNTSSGSWGSQVYYCYQWSYTQGRLDGATLPTFSGSTFTMSSVPALRSVGWHRFRVTWNFDYLGGVGQIKWYVDSTLAPKLTMDFTSANARWANTSSGAYAILGNWSAVAHPDPSFVDDFAWRADYVPEPTSLLALGTGLVGLVGLIRRRR